MIPAWSSSKVCPGRSSTPLPVALEFSPPVVTLLCADATKGAAARSAVAIPTLQLRRKLKTKIYSVLTQLVRRKVER